MGVFKIMFTVEVVKIEAIIGEKKKGVIGINWNFWNFIYPWKFDFDIPKNNLKDLRPRFSF